MNEVSDENLPNYEDCYFACKGAIFTISLETDHLKLNYIRPAYKSFMFNKTLDSNHIIKYEQIIAACGNHTESNNTSDGKYPTEDKCLLSIQFYLKKGSLERKWRRKCFRLSTNYPHIVDKLALLIVNKRDQYLLENNFTPRPKKLLVFVNPYGGRRRAKEIFQTVVEPIFTLAGISLTVVYTQYQNHARNYVEEKDISKFCGVIAVGGDGIAHEIVNGLLCKTQKINEKSIDVSSDKLVSGFNYVKPDLRLGIIPAGSTNALVYSMQGNEDAETSALHIAVGDSHPLDICSIHNHQGKLLKFSFAMTSYGFYGNVLKESEQMRKLGPARYDVAGLKSFLQLHSHAACISYLPATNIINENISEDKTVCRYPCQMCNSKSEKDMETYSLSDWKKVESKFTVVSSAVISCACRKSPLGLSPSAHLADGNTDLILVEKCSKVDFFRYLYAHVGHADRFDFPFVNVRRVKAFKYEEKFQGKGDRRHESCWNTDGEFIEDPNVVLWVHRGLVSMFARGVEN